MAILLGIVCLILLVLNFALLYILIEVSQEILAFVRPGDDCDDHEGGIATAYLVSEDNVIDLQVPKDGVPIWMDPISASGWIAHIEEIIKEKPNSIPTFPQPPDAGNIVESLRALTDDQRIIIFNQFCTHCGDNDPGCMCWFDD